MKIGRAGNEERPRICKEEEAGGREAASIGNALAIKSTELTPSFLFLFFHFFSQLAEELTPRSLT